MSDFSIAEAVEAVGRVARRLGLGEVDSKPLHVSDHISLRLTPSPFVARVKLAAAQAAMQRELDIAAYLAGRGAPVAPPGDGVYVEQGLALSFWQWVPHQPADPDNADHRRLAIEALRHVHEAFAGYPGALPALGEKVAECSHLLRDAPMLGLSDADRRFLSSIGDGFRGFTGEAVPIHGDAGFHNLFITEGGAQWTDFAAACRGPRGWDEVALGISNDLALADLRSFCVSVWCWNLAGDPGKREAAEYHLDLLKRR